MAFIFRLGDVMFAIVAMISSDFFTILAVFFLDRDLPSLNLRAASLYIWNEPLYDRTRCFICLKNSSFVPVSMCSAFFIRFVNILHICFWKLVADSLYQLWQRTFSILALLGSSRRMSRITLLASLFSVLEDFLAFFFFSFRALFLFLSFFLSFLSFVCFFFDLAEAADCNDDAHDEVDIDDVEEVESMD